jgi:hypothetical protein
MSPRRDRSRPIAPLGITAVLHTWGSALTHHPHVHMIVPGGGLSLDGARWVASRFNFLVHVNVLARLFRAKMLAMLTDAHGAGQLKFFNTHAGLADKKTFKRFIAPLRHIKWVVYCKAPFAGPKQVLRYLSRYTSWRRSPRSVCETRRNIPAADPRHTCRTCQTRSRPTCRRRWEGGSESSTEDANSALQCVCGRTASNVQAPQSNRRGRTRRATG